MPTNLPGGMKRRPTKEPFAEEGWGARARNWVKTAERLGDADWTAVMGEVYKRMSGAVTEDGVGAGSDGLLEGSGAGGVGAGDPRACIEL